MKKYFAVKRVKPSDDYTLLLTFSNGEQKVFDMKPYLKKGLFKELRDIELFNTAHISFDTIEWDNELDMDPEVLYTESKKMTLKKYSAPPAKLNAVAEPKSKYGKKK